LAQAEAVADLIDASTAAAARSAVRSLHGDFSREIRALLDQLTELRALTEATLDLPDAGGALSNKYLASLCEYAFCCISLIPNSLVDLLCPVCS
jgi:tRNA U34 5-carboxymethylaminomethyl modifying GTPase MnmE/TrmE